MPSRNPETPFTSSRFRFYVVLWSNQQGIENCNNGPVCVGMPGHESRSELEIHVYGQAQRLSLAAVIAFRETISNAGIDRYEEVRLRSTAVK